MGWNILMEDRWKRRGRKVQNDKQLEKCILENTKITVIKVKHIRVFASAYRQRLLSLFILLLGDIQPVYEALQLLPEGFHLGVDTIQQLVLSDPVEQR